MSLPISIDIPVNKPPSQVDAALGFPEKTIKLVFIQIILIDKNEYSNYGVAPEFIENEKNVLVVDFKSEDEIYRSIVRLLTEEELSKEIVEEGKLSIHKFELDSMINKLEKLYEC